MLKCDYDKQMLVRASSISTISFDFCASYVKIIKLSYSPGAYAFKRNGKRQKDLRHSLPYYNTKHIHITMRYFQFTLHIILSKLFQLHFVFKI